MSGLLAGERDAHRRGEGKEKRRKEGEKENLQKQASAGREQREKWKVGNLAEEVFGNFGNFGNFLYSLLVSDYGANVSLLYAVS